VLTEGAGKVTACREDPGVIEKILTHLEEKSASAKPLDRRYSGKRSK
jgi:hypothetical protein